MLGILFSILIQPLLMKGSTLRTKQLYHNTKILKQLYLL